MKIIECGSCCFPVKLDDADYEKIIELGATITCQRLRVGYKTVKIRVNGKKTQMTKWLTGKNDIDHLDRQTHNMQRTNLREASRSQQAWNQGIRSNNTSGFKGVAFDKQKGLWRACICVGYKTKFLGYFSDAKQAALAYNEAAIQKHGEFAVLNQV